MIEHKNPEPTRRRKRVEVKRLGYSRAQAAEATSLSERKIDYLIEKGALAARKVGGRIVIPAKSLEELIEKGSN